MSEFCKATEFHISFICPKLGIEARAKQHEFRIAGSCENDYYPSNHYIIIDNCMMCGLEHTIDERE